MCSSGATRLIIAFAALAIAGVGQDRTLPEFEVASCKPVDLSKLVDAISMNLGPVRREGGLVGNAPSQVCIRFGS